MKCWDRIGEDFDGIGRYLQDAGSRNLQPYHSLEMFAMILKHLEVAQRQVCIARTIQRKALACDSLTIWGVLKHVSLLLFSWQSRLKRFREALHCAFGVTLCLLEENHWWFNSQVCVAAICGPLLVYVVVQLLLLGEWGRKYTGPTNKHVCTD